MAGTLGRAEDFYQRLGINRNADRPAVVAAYRRLVMSSHPDPCPDDPDASARFRLLTEAYAVLIDPKRRHSYDQSCSIDAVGPVGGATGPGRTESVAIPVKKRSPDGDEVFRAGPVRRERSATIQRTVFWNDRGDIRGRTSEFFSDRWWR